MEPSEQSSEVLVILDPHFGDRLRREWHGQAVWIAMSPSNTPVAAELSTSASSHLDGITVFQYNEAAAPEERLISEFGTVELHRGPYSTNSLFNVLRVIGAQLAPAVRNLLCEYGFSEFERSPEGFIATRSAEEARRLRY